MDLQSPYRQNLALGAFALALSGTAFAQTSADNLAAKEPTTPPTTLTTQLPIDANAPIGSTALARSDSANAAFEKLARDRAFLAYADVAQLPGFGNAFAKADRDADGRLDRTEFSDAWSYYIESDSAAATSTTTTTPQSSVSTAR